ncbi:MAG: Dabb family protein [bacterium]
MQKDENVFHVILFSFKPGSTEGQRQEAFLRLQSMGEDCGGKEAGILFWTVRENMDLRKSVHLVEVSAFKNYAALRKFKDHPKHKEIGELMKQIADWWTGDIYAPMPP